MCTVNVVKHAKYNFDLFPLEHSSNCLPWKPSILYLKSCTSYNDDESVKPKSANICRTADWVLERFVQQRKLVLLGEWEL